MTRARLSDRGSVTAEIAVAVPAIVLVMAVCLGGVSAALVRAQAQDAAAIAARMLARGDAESFARDHVGRVLPGASLSLEPTDDLRCARVTARPRVLGIEIAVVARACALGAG